MSAAILREAAALMRERAEAAMGAAPWAVVEAEGGNRDQRRALGAFSVIPDVALAVADMLDHRAAKYEADVARMRGLYGDSAENFVAEVNEHIVAIAETHLGRADA